MKYIVTDMVEMKEKVAQVIINVPVRRLNKPFSYLIPGHLDFLTAGWRVIVPFGGRNAEGFIIAISDEGSGAEENSGQELKYITMALDEYRWFDEEMLETAKWLSDYYLVSLAQSLRLFIPGKCGVKFSRSYRAADDLELSDCLEKLSAKPAEYSLLLKYIYENGITSNSQLKKFMNLRQSSLKEQFEEKEVCFENVVGYLLRHEYICAVNTSAKTGKPVFKTVYYLEVDREEALEASEALKRKPARQKALRAFLARDNNEMDLRDLKELSITGSIVHQLVKTGLLAMKKVRVLRDSYFNFNKLTDAGIILTSSQQTALDAVGEAIDGRFFKSFLLKGVTGSGKTQVYIQAAAKARRLGRQVIVLVPEIALTSQIVKRFKATFGKDVVVIHSKLSVGERNDAWQRIRSNDAGIVIGARSAIFAPVGNLGLIILDEEHENTYKQEETPRYHAKHVALKRAELSCAPVIFGSATPSVETYYEAVSGRHTVLTMQNRINDASLPPVKIVDMREEMARGQRKVVSPAMFEMIDEALMRGEQAVVLLNRRGYSTFILCRECGHVLKCVNCDISLVYHITSGELCCHYCSQGQDLPDVCPACESRYIRYFGSGTQKVEEEIKLSFPKAKIVRMDQDTTSGKMGHDKILAAFARGEYDILLGTQMVAKGHDVPNVTAVGIVSADTALNLPDFRAAEKTFSLIMQAAGRAGRGEKAGRVVIQTYNPEHYAVIAAASHDYELFYRHEITCRRELRYPPFCRIIKITIQSQAENEAVSESRTISEKLSHELVKLPGSSLVGPFPASTYKVKNIYRMHILIKTTDEEMNTVKKIILFLGIFNLKEVIIDVDPLNVL